MSIIMMNKLTALALIFPLFLAACVVEEKDPEINVVDASNPSSMALLGSGYELDFYVKSIAPRPNSDFGVDATVYSNLLFSNGFFAQVHGVPESNYKIFGDADIAFEVTAKTQDGDEYFVENYEIYYENFNSTTVLEDLALAKIENNKNNVVLWGKMDTITLDRDFVINNDGVKFSLANSRPMNLYVRTADTLSNGIQIVPSAPDNATNMYLQVNNGNCALVSDTVGDLQANGIKQQTCVEAHGYKIPILIEDKTRENSEAKVAHVRKILQYYLDSFPLEVTKAISDTYATIVFFYDDDWSIRPVADYMEENYRFQDLFATETTTVDASENKPDLAAKRDAAFEEVLHFVHDYGLMNVAVQSPSSIWGEMQHKLHELNERAIRAGTYYPNGKDPLIVQADLDAESYDQEYLANAFYAYYDLNNKTYVPQDFESTSFIQLQVNDFDMVEFMTEFFPTRAAFKAQFPGYPNN